VIAAEMERRSTGVGRYVAGLLHGLDRWDHGCQLVLFFQGEPFAHPLWGRPWCEPQFARRGGRPVVWEQLVLPRTLARHRLDLLLCPGYAVPFGVTAPTVVTLHDLSFELYPEEFGWRERWRRRLLARRAARVARRVLVDLPAVADQVRQRYRLNGERIGVVPLGIEIGLLGTAGQDQSVLAGIGVRRPYLLSAGSLLERRQPRLVLEAFAVLSEERPELELVIAGDNRLRRPQLLARWIDELGLGDRVRLLGWVADETLAALYRGAELGLYLSRYEGFGLPPLEALAAGTPVVVSSGLALDAIWPEYPYRAPTLALDEVTAAIRRILDRPEERAVVMADAPRRLAGHDWEASSRLLVRELERALAP
jgi:glycosyltransferase involved in cell wall biosynthesis